MLKFCAGAAVAAVVLCAAPPAAAEPATADPAFINARTGLRPAELAAFDFAGADFSLVAVGRFAHADTARALSAIEEAGDMEAFLPGYPQPAFVTFDLRMAF